MAAEVITVIGDGSFAENDGTAQRRLVDERG